MIISFLGKCTYICQGCLLLRSSAFRFRYTGNHEIRRKMSSRERIICLYEFTSMSPTSSLSCYKRLCLLSMRLMCFYFQILWICLFPLNFWKMELSSSNASLLQFSSACCIWVPLCISLPKTQILLLSSVIQSSRLRVGICVSSNSKRSWNYSIHSLAC